MRVLKVLAGSALAVFFLFEPFSTLAQLQMESLGRGVVAIRTGSSQVYVGWRLLGTDPAGIGFNVYRSSNGGVPTKINASVITTSCNIVDSAASQSFSHSYFVRPVLNGVEQASSAAYVLSAGGALNYIPVPLQIPPGGVTPSGENYSYTANDCSAGDLDGDGEYEIVMKWEPSNAKDNSQSGYTGKVFLDAYKLNGTRLWRIDLGINVRAGAHYTQFQVYDYDGDGRAEVICRTAPGARDGTGSYVGGAARWQNSGGTRPAFNNTDDYRNGSGYVLTGPEFVTVFDGWTGAELASTTYTPVRDPDNNNHSPSSSRLNQVWGDNYGNRVDRFLAATAYLDGKRPSAILCRGYYTRSFVVAWDWRDGQLARRWVFDSSAPGNGAYAGQGNHNLSVADVDHDGKQEILYGACAIDDNGTRLYTTGLGHGDAMHVSDFLPDRPGLESFNIHEPVHDAGSELHDARTGQVFWKKATTSDEGPGRGVAADIYAGNPGGEMWSAGGGISSALWDGNGSVVGRRPGSVNFLVWWDADPVRELLDSNHVDKYGTSSDTRLLTASGASSNNGSKSTPGLSADILGDWREEVIFRASDNSHLRIYVSTIVANTRFYTLMHDPQYRVAIAWQNTAYNQPPHPGFFFGSGMFAPPVPPVSDAALVWRGGGANVWDPDATANWLPNGDWTAPSPVPFASGDSVLFDISGSNHAAVNIVNDLEPESVTVHAPKDFTFSGAGSITGDGGLLKAGPGKLTILNSNDFSGPTVVAGGALFVNGALRNSAVTVERRGTPEGPSMVGGNGLFGNGLILHQGIRLVVGTNTNLPGTLTIQNNLVEHGGVTNYFDLSNDPDDKTGANDSITIDGDLVLNGINVVEIQQLDSSLGDGVYPLFQYSGALVGNLNNLVLHGQFLQPVALTNPPGMIGLLSVVPDAPPTPPGSLAAVAVGISRINLSWTDESSDELAFEIERSTDNVNFALVQTLPANTTIYSDTGLLPATTYYYRVRSKNLAGSSVSAVASASTPAAPPLLVWRGDGSANTWDLLTTPNWRANGSATVFADGTHVLFDNSGSNNTAIALQGTLQPETVTVNASKDFSLAGSGSIAGTGSLRKSGSGTLTIAIENLYTGGTAISNGTIVLANTDANRNGLGSGVITLAGGTLEFAGVNGSSSPDYGGNTNQIIVPAGHVGTIRVPQRFLSPGLNGRLSGGGRLDLIVNYVRGDISGDWTAFTGLINVSGTGSGADDFRFSNPLGFPAARLHLAQNVFMYSRAPSGSVIPIGEFSAQPGATVSASGGSGLGGQNPVTFRVGARNTTATNAATFQGMISLVKEGTGTWILTGTNSYSGTTTVTGGALIVNGNHAAANGTLTVETGGRLGGTGIIGGNAVVNGALSPGASIGTLTFNQSLTFGAASTTIVEMNRAASTHDRVRVLGTAALAGTLVVIELAPQSLKAGDQFQIIDANTITGTFSGYDLPEIGPDLAWNTSKVSENGTLWVVRATPPLITEVRPDGASIQLSASGGTPGWPCQLVSSTDLTLPLELWTVVATSEFDAEGKVSLNAPANGNEPGRYYRLSVP